MPRYRIAPCLLAIITIAFYALFTPPAVAATQADASSQMSITSVSELNPSTNEWTITLNTGATLRVENRAFDVGGTAPHTGPIDTFSDQGWMPILGYYGYATFNQHQLHYHAKR